MLWKMGDLKEFSLRAKDGVIGELAELYFSDDNWTVRYIVVATGDWLERRDVLISPMALDLPNGPAKVIPANVTREQVRDAPPVDTKKPVSRHYEIRYHDYYGWPYYWIGGAGWGPFLTPGELVRAGVDREEIEIPEDPHLRSSSEVEGYRFEGRDGRLGHVQDFIVSDESWAIRYLEIDTRPWWPGGKKVLLATQWVNDVSWQERKLRADVSRDTVKEAPEYDESAPITETYQNELAQHYGRNKPSRAGR